MEDNEEDFDRFSEIDKSSEPRYPGYYDEWLKKQLSERAERYHRGESW